MSRKEGLTEEKLGALPDYEGASVFAPEEMAVLRYADAIADTPVHVSDEVYADLAEHYDEEQIVEITSAIAWEHYRARFNHALGVEAEGFSEGGLLSDPRVTP